jgi:hypothetical protein
MVVFLHAAGGDTVMALTDTAICKAKPKQKSIREGGLPLPCREDESQKAPYEYLASYLTAPREALLPIPNP